MYTSLRQLFAGAFGGCSIGSSRRVAAEHDAAALWRHSDPVYGILHDVQAAGISHQAAPPAHFPRQRSDQYAAGFVRLCAGQRYCGQRRGYFTGGPADGARLRVVLWRLYYLHPLWDAVLRFVYHGVLDVPDCRDRFTVSGGRAGAAVGVG